MKSPKVLLITILAALVSIAIISCGDDDDTSTSGFRAELVGFGSETPVPDKTVIALSNTTAEETGLTTTSSGSGMVDFADLPTDDEGLVGFKVLAGNAEYVDTYQFNIEADRTDETLWIVPIATFTMAPKMAGIEVDDTLAIGAGGFYWVNAAGQEEPVGCATMVAADGQGDIRYFAGNNLPASIEAQPSINPLNGYWVAANMTPGQVTLQGKVGDTVVGSTTFFAYPGQAISIGNLYVDEGYASNPGTCE